MAHVLEQLVDVFGVYIEHTVQLRSQRRRRGQCLPQVGHRLVQVGAILADEASMLFSAVSACTMVLLSSSSSGPTFALAVSMWPSVDLIFGRFSSSIAGALARLP